MILCHLQDSIIPGLIPEFSQIYWGTSGLTVAFKIMYCISPFSLQMEYEFRSSSLSLDATFILFYVLDIYWFFFKWYRLHFCLLTYICYWSHTIRLPLRLVFTGSTAFISGNWDACQAWDWPMSRQHYKPWLIQSKFNIILIYTYLQHTN